MSSDPDATPNAAVQPSGIQPSGRQSAGTQSATRTGDAGPAAEQHPPAAAAPRLAREGPREYATDAITVEWRADRCIHSGWCVRTLPAVFEPRARPWVHVNAADADAIAGAVRRCPTGALRFVRHDGGAQEAPDAPTTLTPVRDGPLYVRGDVEVRDLSGAVVRRESRTAVCRCGRAAHMPFCDGVCHATGWREPTDA
jgi:uncharacterized Fe-S cluster protein YjdI